jgi:hypothetical protein
VLARLSWRAGIPVLGLRLLNPIVRAEPGLHYRPKPVELVEYARCLVSVGAEREALQLLEPLDGHLNPDVVFCRALAYLYLRDYVPAIALLGRYVRDSRVPTPVRLEAKVRLAVALVFERRYERAKYLLHELIYQTGIRKLPGLHGTCLELAAYNCLVHRKLREAEKFLDTAEQLLTASAGREAFYVAKWKAILSLVRHRGDAASRRRLAEVRSAAYDLGDWESLRDLDRFDCVARRDGALFLHLYFGTPIPSFRAGLVADFPGAPTPPAHWDRELGGEGAQRAILDIREGRVGDAGLPYLRAPHRLLIVLASDFYRPFRVAEIFARLFPGDPFNPDSSALRVHQAIQRLRAWLAEHAPALQIRADRSTYSLAATGPITLRHALDPGPVSREHRAWDRLRLQWPNIFFSARQAASFLGISLRSANRVLNQARAAGVLERARDRAYARYRFRVGSV